MLVDFAAVDPGTTLILYNDCPVPLPCFDPRYDHHTGDPDRTAEGGAPPTVPGYGPNTRTLLQLRVTGTPAPPYDLDRLWDRLPAAYAPASVPRSCRNRPTTPASAPRVRRPGSRSTPAPSSSPRPAEHRCACR